MAKIAALIQNPLLLHFLVVNILRIAGMELLLARGHMMITY